MNTHPGTEKNTDQHNSDQAAADLAFIRAMMGTGRNRLSIDGKLLGLWGILLATGFGSLYISIVAQAPFSPKFIWVPILALGWALSFYIGRKRPAGNGDNPILRGYGASWFSLGVGMLIVFTANIIGADVEPRIYLMLTSVLLASTLFVISNLMRLTWLRYVATGWWALLAFFTMTPATTLNHIAAMAVASIALLALPGFKLMQMAKDGSDSV